MTKPRSIFEDVSEQGAKPEARTGGIDRGGASGGNRRLVRIWLAMLFVLVAAMVVVGGLTRLTDSGLSITEWAPITGAFPPMSEAAWSAEFEKYQKIPEFKLQNSHMDLAAFKEIYWWEWGHRQLGRFIGLVWAVGFLLLLVTKSIPTGWVPRFLGLGALGGLQGAIGWWMVSSGLTGERVDVAAYRLAIHLGLAFLILGLISWYLLSLGRDAAKLMTARRAREGKLWGLSTGLLHLAFLQILLGALVAGIDAGRSFVDWPWMAGQVFPPDAFEISPIWRNFFENAGLVQFMHRMMGYLVVVFVLIVWRASRRSPNADTRLAFSLVAVMVLAQAVLGIATVLQAAQLHVAITHQIGAILSFVLILNARFMSGYPNEQSVRG
ncbi:Heme A synthase [Aliiroseovarius sp. xm-m-379]|uniref:heme A synthase n=1 Tax=unclassified Aliiroseovarius TaxID=2623558 RepID=UPI001568758D|nr:MULTISPECIES: heme A synthase [unclassified Aliiroseovarius]NRP11943.1 Heme A synthase [Aliiroseovarius sp. xm-d-517]NRP25166.1 Heme A synthase [Aliiroseovarius sp. xm-m-379]NRP31102.1 Heme A synthase [Aliiroseovarius sp. xm-m-314]NRP33965.1 Heme A synthase [Aliiroseovarius sp. xm-a-104]NRP41563.1 Heme A synthase [Aliiroseovarius sp. xm-m-339-2]